MQVDTKTHHRSQRPSLLKYLKPVPIVFTDSGTLVLATILWTDFCDGIQHRPSVSTVRRSPFWLGFVTLTVVSGHGIDYWCEIGGATELD